MVAATPFAGGTAYAPPLRTSLERLRGSLLWLTGFSGAFVFMEPSPYEVASLLTIMVFAVTGLTIRLTIMPLVVLLLIYNIGFSIAVIPILAQQKAVTWVLVSWYMSATAIFFAAMLGQNTEQRLQLLVRGFTMAAVVAALAGVVGYFQIIPRVSDIFTKFGRAQGTFNDPNVLGAFLIFPALVALQRVLNGTTRDFIRGGGMLLLFVVALLLSFSRAAWGQFAFCALVLMALTFITSRSDRERMRIIALAIAGVVVMALFLAALLSVEKVAALFQERASLDQSYDSGHLGRFGRHALGFLLALDTPLGIGPLQFAKIFPEDPHNSYLNAFMSGGWISGITYLTIVLLTLVVGFRYLFVRSPWQRIYLVAFTAFLGVAGESAIIDSDHWRHYFLSLGVLWGLIAANVRYSRQQRRENAPRNVPPPVRSLSGLAPAGRAA